MVVTGFFLCGQIKMMTDDGHALRFGWEYNRKAMRVDYALAIDLEPGKIARALTWHLDKIGPDLPLDHFVLGCAQGLMFWMVQSNLSLPGDTQVRLSELVAKSYFMATKHMQA